MSTPQYYTYDINSNEGFFHNIPRTPKPNEYTWISRTLDISNIAGVTDGAVAIKLDSGEVGILEDACVSFLPDSANVRAHLVTPMDSDKIPIESKNHAWESHNFTLYFGGSPKYSVNEVTVNILSNLTLTDGELHDISFSLARTIADIPEWEYNSNGGPTPKKLPKLAVLHPHMATDQILNSLSTAHKDGDDNSWAKHPIMLEHTLEGINVLMASKHLWNPSCIYHHKSTDAEFSDYEWDLFLNILSPSPNSRSTQDVIYNVLDDSINYDNGVNSYVLTKSGTLTISHSKSKS